ncbi:hypothetical protein [Desertibacillus haloalkaliphilus]|uniref:hypothetical protein n=1 Tax=Desertibacillus haloalkaliphilus TaxID=1328930 RepID=UPI001C263290|nr:hypothetical protein [Desertibacillus haloalkaliphilus]MBU8905247.1 hypothetical protein [Desertibacillus haloalkaliphilus]
MRLIILMVAFIVIGTGCSFGDNLDEMNKNRVLSEMKAEREDQYHLYTFWTSFPTENWEEADIDDELKNEFEAYHTIDYSKADLRHISFKQKESAGEYINGLDINEFPTFIVLDHEGIILRTTDVNQINEFLKEIPREAFKE